MAKKDDRPGWKYYTARKKVEEMIDDLTRLNFGTCRDAGGRITDGLLNASFYGARDTLMRLAGELKYREIKEIERKDETQ